MVYSGRRTALLVSLKSDILALLEESSPGDPSKLDSELTAEVDAQVAEASEAVVKDIH